MTKRVIFAEDDVDLRDSLVSWIADFVPNVDVEGVPNGETLVERVRKGNYSVVMTDYDMGPGMNGIDAIIAIRKFDSEIPIYMVSGSDVQQRALDAGATGYFLKDGKLIAGVENAVLKHTE